MNKKSCFILLILLLNVILEIHSQKKKCTSRPQSCGNQRDVVCGYVNNNQYKNYRNKCQACKNRNVKYWEKGSCDDD